MHPLILTKNLIFYICLICFSLFLTACTPSPAIKFITYTDTQAERGRKIYLGHCVLCHGTNLSNAQFGAPLKGAYFQSRWQNKTVAELYIITSVTMPPDNPMSLMKQEYTDVLAYVLQANEIQSGTEELPTDQQIMMRMKIPW